MIRDGESNFSFHFLYARQNAVVNNICMRNYRGAHLFIKFTWKTTWKDIEDTIFKHQDAKNISDIVSRVFRLKVKNWLCRKGCVRKADFEDEFESVYCGYAFFFLFPKCWSLVVVTGFGLDVRVGNSVDYRWDKPYDVPFCSLLRTESSRVIIQI